jgi:hypothetical protein
VGALDPGERRAVEAARRALAARSDAPPEDMLVLSIRAVEWPDGSLGCPQPDMMYTQAIVPGYALVLQAGGERHTVHTDSEGRAVVCDRAGGGATPAPRLTPGPIPREENPMPEPEQQRAEQAARRVVAAETGAAPQEISVVSIEEREWSDSSLGCPAPGMMYTQVITPGYMVVLEAGGERHTVHTDRSGRAVLCEGGE